MSEIRVRQALPEEVTPAGRIAADAYRAAGLLDGAGDYEKVLLDAASRAEQAELLVAVDDAGELLGSVTLARFGTPFAQVAEEGELEFRMLATAAQAQGRGVGELLTRAVIDRATELGCARVVLCLEERNARARRLYDRLGFRRLPERDWAPLPAVKLLAFGLDLTSSQHT